MRRVEFTTVQGHKIAFECGPPMGTVIQVNNRLIPTTFNDQMMDWLESLANSQSPVRDAHDKTLRMFEEDPNAPTRPTVD